MLRWFLQSIVVPALALIASICVGMLFLWVTGYPVFTTFQAIVQQSFQDWYGFGQVLHTTTLLTFTGLAVAVAFHAGLFNIGAEGQLYIGAMALGIVGYYISKLPKEVVMQVPPLLAIVGLCLVAMLAAGIYALIPGVLKVLTGAHEVITTIMMNFIALAWINYLLRYDPNSFAVPATVRTPAFPQAFRLPKLSTMWPVFQGSIVNCSLFLAVGAAVIVWAFLRFTKTGFELRAVGKNSLAARLAGIAPGRLTILAMFVSGALAGLVGVAFVLGHKGYFEEGFSAGLGFLGIAVALLAYNHPIGVLFTAFLFGVLNYGKVAAAGEIPMDIINILEATMIFSIVIVNRLMANFLQRLAKRRLAAFG